jgi:PD-(D/E)XK nuclease superfamily
MIPKTLSATSMSVAELCMARWEAEMFHRGKGQQNTAASLGSSVHGALELFVIKCVNATEFPATEKQLLEFFKMSYATTFGSMDFDTLDYADGVEMLKRWMKRTDFSTFTVLSAEVKENFPITTSVGNVPFNYIWDRYDQLGPAEYRVVDYKTNRWGINPADLKKKIQARAYAVAAQIKLKGQQVDRIWVEFDMLRHDGPVGTVFTYEENAAMWKFMKDTAERIIATPEGSAPETLNPECNFCVRKVRCGALRKNLVVGGIGSVASATDAVDLRSALSYQGKAIESAIKELDTMILAEAKKRDLVGFESDMNELTIGVSSRRSVDADRLSLIIGDALFNKYGGKSITMANFDKLLKGSELTDEQKAQVRGLVYSNKGEPRVNSKPKNPIDTD